MEDWELDFTYLQARHFIKDKLGLDKLPDLRSILFIIGVQELGKGPLEFSKEEKQDLMHIAVCSLLENDGYYEFEGKDADGWPHWKIGKPFKLKGADHQEKLLKQKIVTYFNINTNSN